jgi:glutamate synthase domain-containing protein 3
MNVCIILRAWSEASYNSESAIIAGNAALYGATDGKAALQEEQHKG